MKNLVVGLIATVLFSSITSAQNTSKIENESESRALPVLGGLITTQSHLVSFQGDCYTVWVGVFWTDGDGSALICFGTSTIGSGCRIANLNNSLCENAYFKEDYIENSNSKELKYCLIDCLKDDRVYKLYQVDKERISREIKK